MAEASLIVLGFVLSMSPMTGINFLKLELSEDVQLAPSLRSEQPLSVLEHLKKAFADEGTKMWPSKTAEWFAVRLITKVLVVPHSHGDNTIPNIQKAYLPLVRDLVRKILMSRAFPRSCHFRMIVYAYS